MNVLVKIEQSHFSRKNSPQARFLESVWLVDWITPDQISGLRGIRVYIYYHILSYIVIYYHILSYIIICYHIISYLYMYIRMIYAYITRYPYFLASCLWRGWFWLYMYRWGVSTNEIFHLDPPSPSTGWWSENTCQIESNAK